MRGQKNIQVFLGGHSYGGRQASMLVSEEPQLADGLLLLSYPLHPPRKPNQLRTSHFPKLTTPTFFVHGTRDPFGTTAEMNSALELIPGSHAMFEVDGAGHDLLPKVIDNELPSRVVISPVLAGGGMWMVGTALRKRNKKAMQIESFGYGFAFALGMAMVRFLFAK